MGPTNNKKKKKKKPNKPSCYRQCDTLRPNKKNQCEQRCTPKTKCLKKCETYDLEYKKNNCKQKCFVKDNAKPTKKPKKSSCLKQCETVHPNKRGECEQKCSDINNNGNKRRSQKSKKKRIK